MALDKVDSLRPMSGLHIHTNAPFQFSSASEKEYLKRGIEKKINVGEQAKKKFRKDQGHLCVASQ